ncbi:MAG: hypothetical protein VX621_04785 [Candidatus Thermoplasmatota archaeon]|nr:hypothetical protein [Candidatus Thermoplasmatota archaeon]
MPMYRLVVNQDDSDSIATSGDLEESYRIEIEELIKNESERRITENKDPLEESRLHSLSLVDLFEKNHPDLVIALMVRLGPVRAALEGHGGSLVVFSGEIEINQDGKKNLSLVVDLDGACVSCGAAPGTLKGIQDDLLMDDEIISVRFNSGMLEWFDEIQRDFLLKFGGVSFV